MHSLLSCTQFHGNNQGDLFVSRDELALNGAVRVRPSSPISFPLGCTHRASSSFIFLVRYLCHSLSSLQSFKASNSLLMHSRCSSSKRSTCTFNSHNSRQSSSATHSKERRLRKRILWSKEGLGGLRLPQHSLPIQASFEYRRHKAAAVPRKLGAEPKKKQPHYEACLKETR